MNTKTSTRNMDSALYRVSGWILEDTDRYERDRYYSASFETGVSWWPTGETGWDTREQAQAMIEHFEEYARPSLRVVKTTLRRLKNAHIL